MTCLFGSLFWTVIVLVTLNDHSYGWISYQIPQKVSLGLIRRSLSDSNKLEEPVIDYFRGPTSSFEKIEKGFTLQELGINLLIGKSVVSPGRGLFLSLANESISESIIPKGTILCGYSKGVFTDLPAGDKVVSAQFFNLSTAVIFRKEILSLQEVLEQVLMKNLSQLNVELDLADSSVLQGHSILFTGNQFTIYPDVSNFANYYLVPFRINSTSDLTVMNAGSFANDLAFSEVDPPKDEEEYLIRSQEQNPLQLIWRLEYQDGTIYPTWPVVVFSKDLSILNHHPIEIGIHYGWGYWNSKSLGSWEGKSNRLLRNRIFKSKVKKLRKKRQY